MYIVANFKSNFLSADIIKWLDIVGPETNNLPETVKVMISPTMVHLCLTKNHIESKKYNILLCAQNVSPFNLGAYSGEVEVSQLSEFVKFVLVGHSERKKFFSENTEIINKKLINTLKSNLTPIIGISDRINPETESRSIEEKINNVKAYVKNIANNITGEEIKKIIFLYEPDNAISKQVGMQGIGEAVPTEEVVVISKEILKIYPENLVFYGGSIKSSNIKTYLTIKEISGFVIGAASLDPNEFLRIIKSL